MKEGRRHELFSEFLFYMLTITNMVAKRNFYIVFHKYNTVEVY